MNHLHDWQTIGFHVIETPSNLWRLDMVVVVQVCSECRDARWLQADKGMTASQEQRAAEDRAADQARRAKQREYNRRAKERKASQSEGAA